MGEDLSLFNFANICQELTESLWSAGHFGRRGRAGRGWMPVCSGAGAIMLEGSLGWEEAPGAPSLILRKMK